MLGIGHILVATEIHCDIIADFDKHSTLATANNNRIFDSLGSWNYSLGTVLTCLCIGVSLIALFAHF